MSAAILSRPTKSGCNWNAFGNPVIFKLQRQDHAFDQIQDNAGFVRLRINGTDVTSYYQVGNTVYYDGAIFATSATITASTFSGGHTLITVNVAYVSTDAGIINNLSKRTDYRLEYNFKSIAGTELLAADLTISPNSEGIMLLNASLLKNLLSADWTAPVAINEADTTGSIGFYVSYQEYYDGALQGSVTNDSGNPIYGLLGANQIGSADGSNMLAYFPADDTKYWLTKFQIGVLKKAVAWFDWYFTASFIWPSTYSEISMYTRYYDGADEFISEVNNDLVDNSDAVNRINVNTDTASIPSGTKKIEVVLGEAPLEGTGSDSLFVAVSSSTFGGQETMSSTNGNTWDGNPTAPANNWVAVTYGNGKFVAVGSDGLASARVIVSTDGGETWVAKTTPGDNSWSDVHFANNMFVAIASSGAGTGDRVMTSTDAETWTLRTTPADNLWVSVSYGNGLWVAVSGNGFPDQVMTSTDGITWTLRSVPTDDEWARVVFGNNKFVAVGIRISGGGVMVSSDGITWTNQTSESDRFWRGLTYGGGKFVACNAQLTEARKFMYSSDGITWTGIDVAALSANQLFAVTYLNGLFVSVGNEQVGYSVDGTVWQAGTPAGTASWTSVIGGSMTPAPSQDIPIGSAHSAGEYSFSGTIELTTVSDPLNDPALTIKAYNDAVEVSTLEIYEPGVGVGSFTFTFDPVTVYTIPGTWNKLVISFSGLENPYTFEWSVYSSALNILMPLVLEMREVCDYDEDRLPIAGQNPIMLQWKNSIGGDAQWLFPYYHEYNYSTRGGRKAKRIILFDQDLNATQWEAISELISTNEIYSPAIVDLENTNTVNATSKQVGRQVYMIDQDGNKTGVIVIPSSERINARDIGHRIAIEIELPEFQEA